MDHRHLRRDNQRAILRHQEQHRIGRTDHRSRRIDLKTIDDARHGGLDLQTRQLLLKGATLFGQLQLAVLQITQTGDRLFAATRRQLDHLDVDLGNSARGLRLGGRQFTHAPAQARFLALQRQHPAGLCQTFFKQALLIHQFLADQLKLYRQRFFLRLDPAHLIGNLAATLAQLFDLVLQRIHPRMEQAILTFDDFGNIRIRCSFGQKLLVKHNRIGIIALCLKPSSARHQFEKLPFRDRKIRRQQSGIQSDQGLTRFHRVTLIHEDILHKPTIKVLYDLPVAVHLDPTRGNHRAGNLGQGRPRAEPTHQHKHGKKADCQRRPRRPVLLGVAHCTPPPPVLCLICWWFATISRSTSSFGPKAVRIPPSSTRSMSHS